MRAGTYDVELELRIDGSDGQTWHGGWRWEVSPGTLERSDTGWSALIFEGDIAGQVVTGTASLNVNRPAERYVVKATVKASEGFDLDGYTPDKPRVRLLRQWDVRPVRGGRGHGAARVKVGR